MNITNQNNTPRLAASRKAASQITKLAAWSVLAGTILCSPGFCDDDTPDDQRPAASTATVEPAPAPATDTPDSAESAPDAKAPSSDESAPATNAPVSAEPAPAPAPATDTPVPTPAPEPVVAVDPAPVVPIAPAASAPAEPKTPEPKAVEPKIAEPLSPQPKAIEPAAPVPVPAPETAKVAVPVPATAAPATMPAKGNEASLVATGLSANGNISLMVNKSQVISTRVPYKRVSIGQPEVADVNLVGPSEVLLTAKKPGSTQLIIWDDQDRSQVIEVVVGFDLRGLETQIAMMFPKGKITVESANGTIVLRGHVPDLQTAQKAAQVAAPYGSGDKTTAVLNFLEVSGGQQVVLQVRFAEVSRAITQNLGFNVFATDGKFALGFSNGPGGNPIGALAGGSASGVSSQIPVFGSARMGQAQFEYFINALRQNSLLRILAEPNLTAISGQPASFLAGGEFPIPVPQASGGGTAITIEYKQYGVQLNFTPTVLGDGRIRLLCTPAVSELDYTHSVSFDGFTVPGLTTRNVNTTVELAEGQTFALAGLLQNQVSASKSITPLLGDLPVLGTLFRSVNYQRNETELVILVTPRMAEALNPNQVPTVPGETWRDPTEAQLFLGTDLGGPAPDTRHAPVRSSRFYGTTGFSPAPVQQK